MSRPPARPVRGLRPLAAALAAVAAVGLTAGCGAGQLSQTARKQSSVAGVNTAIGRIQIRDALVAYPETDNAWPVGSDVPVRLRLVNDGSSADQLVGASAENVASVAFRNLSASPSASPIPSNPPTGSPTAEPSPSVSGGPSPAPSAGTASPDAGIVPTNPQTTAPLPTASSPVPRATVVPPGQSLPLTLPPVSLVTLDTGQPQLVLTGITESLSSGDNVRVTLRFRDAGEITLTLPVSPPASPGPRVSLTHAEGSEEE